MRKPREHAFRSRFMRKIIEYEIEYESAFVTTFGMSKQRRIVKRNAVLDCSHKKPMTGGRWKKRETTFCDQCAEDAGYGYLSL